MLRDQELPAERGNAEQDRKRIHGDSLEPAELADRQVRDLRLVDAPEGRKDRDDPGKVDREGSDRIAKTGPARASFR